jgi:hypothetical protein
MADLEVFLKETIFTTRGLRLVHDVVPATVPGEHPSIQQLRLGRL